MKKDKRSSLPDPSSVLDTVNREMNVRNGRVTLEWFDDAHTIILHRLEGAWSWHEVWWDLFTLRYWTEQSPHPVDIVIDLTQSDRFPKALWLSTRLPWLWFSLFWPKRLNRVVIVGDSRELQRLLDLRKKIAPDTMRYFRVVATMEEALTLLHTWVRDEEKPYRT